MGGRQLFLLWLWIANALAYYAPPLSKGVVIVFRHGDRTPISPYKSDPYRDPKYWPVPFGELTAKGMAQHYQLGKVLRKKYGHLIGNVFNSDEIYVRSSDKDRTLMSAQANLAGLYPIHTSDRFDPDMPWRPAAIHTVAHKDDTLIQSDTTCSMFIKKRQELYETPYFQNLTNQYDWVRRYVNKYSEQNMGTDFKQLSYIYDTLKIEEAYNFTLPKWTQKVYPNLLREIANISFAVDTFTPQLARLSAGPLAKQITQNLIAIEQKEVSQKMFIYSAHDTNIANLLGGMNLLKYEIPPYASNLIFELIPNGQESSVRILYQMNELEIPNCVKCPLSKFAELYSDLFPDNIVAECSLGEQQWTNFDRQTMVFSLLIFLLAFVISLTIITYIIQKMSSVKYIYDYAE